MSDRLPARRLSLGRWVKAVVAALVASLLIPAPAAVASFPGANGRLATDGGGLGADIFLVNSDGSDLMNLTGTPDMADTQPAFSADGSRIALAHSPGLCCGDLHPYVMNADGTDLHPVNPAIDFESTDPSWSPGGDQLAFDGYRSGNSDIFKMNVDGTGLTQLTTSPAAEYLPRWSPDGSQIAFLSNASGTTQLYSIDPNGGDATQLTAIDGNVNAVDWSPEASRLVYGAETSAGESIFVINRDGSNSHLLYHSDVFGYTAPTWSPDGTEIAFLQTAADDPNHRDIWLMNADGGNPHLAIVGWTSETNNLAWQPLPPAPPTNKAQCLKGGWQTFKNPRFKNEGDCVSYVATGGRNSPDG